MISLISSRVYFSSFPVARKVFPFIGLSSINTSSSSNCRPVSFSLLIRFQLFSSFKNIFTDFATLSPMPLTSRRSSVSLDFKLSIFKNSLARRLAVNFPTNGMPREYNTLLYSLFLLSSILFRRLSTLFLPIFSSFSSSSRYS